MTSDSKESGRRRRDRKESAAHGRLTKAWGWLAGVLAAALATSLAGLLTGGFAALGRVVSGAAPPAEASAPAKPPSPGAPLTVTAEPVTDMCNADWVTPKKPAEFRTVPTANLDTAQDWQQWSPTAKGALASPATVAITVQGRSSAEVILTELEIRVHQRRPPLAGTYLGVPCGDAGAARWLQVDLDENPPRPRPSFKPGNLPPDVRSWERKPIEFPYEVSISDAEIFVVTTQTRNCDCTWTAELSWSSGGQTGTMVIDDHGKPFRTTSSRNTTACKVYPTGVACGEEYRPPPQPNG